MKESSLEILSAIQVRLNAPKNQFNKFGKYKYRNCEDILEALKPLIKEYSSPVCIADTIVEIGGRIYVKATAFISIGSDTFSAEAFAREEENKKGMDSAQLTGSTSSYARKYALNGLFCIDDNKDADSNEDGGQGDPPKPKQEYKQNEEVSNRAQYDIIRKKIAAFPPNKAQSVLNEYRKEIAAMPKEGQDGLNKLAKEREESNQ